MKLEFAKIDQLPNASTRHESYLAAIGKTSIDITYSTPSTDKEIQDYYDGELKRNGWKLVDQKKVYDWGRDLGGKTFVYTKLDLFIDMQYAGDRKGYGWAYGFYLGAKINNPMFN